MLSIDYSLAPEAQFPRAIEEIFYAYCWALKNLEYLGTTGERIVFAGDSAGANLNTGLIVKCIEEGVPLPHGIVNIYGIFNVGFHVTPSSLLFLVDPILPYLVVSSLIEAYAGYRDSSEKKLIENFDSNGNLIDGKESKNVSCEKFNFKFYESPHLSPYTSPDSILKQFPPMKLVAGILDPLLDDSVQLGSKLKSLNVDVDLDVLSGLYHGFLYFIQVRIIFF
jgi:hormone-sensitive lipase